MLVIQDHIFPHELQMCKAVETQTIYMVFDPISSCSHVLPACELILEVYYCLTSCSTKLMSLILFAISSLASKTFLIDEGMSRIKILFYWNCGEIALTHSKLKLFHQYSWLNVAGLMCPDHPQKATAIKRK